MDAASRRAVFAETHKAIDEAAHAVADCLTSSGAPSLSYPPGIELTSEEQQLLSSVTVSPQPREVLKKIIADACSQPLFHMLSLLDGVTEPYVIEIPDWTGGTLSGDPDGLMLYDEFLDRYWDYDERKKS